MTTVNELQKKFNWTDEQAGITKEEPKPKSESKPSKPTE
jgi:hypothetical protein